MQPLPRPINWIPALVLYSVAVPLGWFSFVFPFLDIVSIPVTILALIFGLIVHYQCWNAVPHQIRRTSPGKAVGFLFIPFFNFYWGFVSYYGLCADLAKATGKPSGEGLGLTYAILNCLCFFVAIPFVGDLWSTAGYLIWLLMTIRVVGRANELITGRPPPPGIG